MLKENEKTVVLKTIKDFQKEAVSHIPKEYREELANSVERNTNDFGMDKMLPHVYNDEPLNDPHLEDMVKKQFPVKAKKVSLEELVINKELIIGPQASPYFIDVDHLIFDGGSLTAITTALTIKTKKITITNKKSSHQYHIAVLGEAGAKGATGSKGSEYIGRAKDGTNSSAPTPGICTGAKSPGSGGDAKNGGDGGIGGQGKKGVANWPATIKIESFGEESPFLQILLRSGEGGEGGDGGIGGVGQAGGNGGKGCNSGCEGTNGGSGGTGGNGGNGGDGGIGGSGCNGNPVYISCPEKNKNLISVIAESAHAGSGGSGGSGGAGGFGGSGGSGGKHAADGNRGSGGKNGNSGKKGSTGGKVGSAPHVIYNYI